VAQSAIGRCRPQVCSDWHVISPHEKVTVYASLPSPFRLGDRKQAKLERLGYIMQYGSVLLERLQVRPLLQQLEHREP
jgi:hypothetical protein